MIITPHPGPWQYFVKRKDNVGLSINEVTQKYKIEESKHFSQLEYWINQNSWNNHGGGPINNPVNSGKSGTWSISGTIDGADCDFIVSGDYSFSGTYTGPMYSGDGLHDAFYDGVKDASTLSALFVKAGNVVNATIDTEPSFVAIGTYVKVGDDITASGTWTAS